MKSVKTFHRFLVLVAGLELARSLERGILRHLRQKSVLPKTIKIRAFLAENSLKTPKNQFFSYIIRLLKIP